MLRTWQRIWMFYTLVIRKSFLETLFSFCYHQWCLFISEGKLCITWLGLLKISWDPKIEKSFLEKIIKY